MKFYKNAQWVVTPDGLDTITGDYFIDAERLTEKNRGRYDWPEHMAGKTWVSLPLFCKAYAAALEYHSPGYNRIVLADCIVRAFKKEARSTRFDIISQRMKPQTGDGLMTYTADHLFEVNDTLNFENQELARYLKSKPKDTRLAA
ncbi:hypothetical protein ACXIUS_28880 [Bosea thiooxidans]